jgi:tRNA dimethylallyltransferase
VRRRLERELRRRGLPALFGELERVDAVYAEKVGPADRQRILRALEVYRATFRPLSSFPVPHRPREAFRFLLIGLDRDRDDLYRRIEHRVRRMFREGLVDEIKKLKRLGFTESDPGMQAIGYREFFHMERTGCTTLAEVRDLIVRNSRRYAKRQITFFRRFDGVRWFHPDHRAKIAALARAFVADVG